MSDDDASDDGAGPDLAAGVRASDLSDGGTLKGFVEGEAVLLARTGGRVHAVGATCTHLGGPLAEGVLVDGEVRCPWHHARFALATGEAVGAPALDPLPCFAVEERGGRVFVTGRRPRPERPRPAAEPPERVLILGGGAGGHACAEMLARAGHGGRVTVLTDDPDPPYDRTFCSKQYLIGMAGRDDCALDGAGIYGPEGASDGVVRLVRGRAAAIDLERREVVTEDGARHGFDALVIATGAEPKRPEGPGLDGPGVFVLRTLADADAIIAAAEAGRRAVVLGASFVGLEVAASLRQRDVEVEVVAPDEVPLEKVVGAEVGRMIQGVHEEHGVRFRLGRTATGFDGRRLALDDGSAVEADLVVAGIGVAPRTGLAREAGLAMATEDEGGGIMVDARLESSAPGVFAVGDVASYPNAHVGRRIRVEHWVHAERQGQHVARVLMGEAGPYADPPFFWSAHFDTGLRYLGHVGRIEGVEVDGTVEGREFAMRLRGEGREEAFVTCNRDPGTLEEEARWEKRMEAAPRPAG